MVQAQGKLWEMTSAWSEELERIHAGMRELVCRRYKHVDLDKIANGEVGEVEEVHPQEDPTYRQHLTSLRCSCAHLLDSPQYVQSAVCVCLYMAQLHECDLLRKSSWLCCRHAVSQAPCLKHWSCGPNGSSMKGMLCILQQCQVMLSVFQVQEAATILLITCGCWLVSACLAASVLPGLDY